MADKSVGELIAAQSVTPTDLFVLEQNGTAKKLTGQVLENWLVSFADGHGGIQSIVKHSTSGLVDTYRITLADTTTFDFLVTNGRSVRSITKTGNNGLVDTYTIRYNDNTTDTLTVTNGAKGDKGDRADIWVKYASQKPTASSHSFGDVPDAWIGIATGHNMDAAPTDWQQYTWFQIKGEKGDTGNPATLTSSSVEYQVSNSGTIIPSGAWSSSVPVVAQGKYLWTRTTNNFNTGSPVISYSVSRMGLDGSGSVSSVANISPDENGNVPLTAEHVGAVPSTGGDMTGELRMNGQHISGLNLPTANDHAANMGFVNQQVRKAAPRNLLDNSDFRNPVNQRGKTSYTANGYTIDRWRLDAVGDSGVSLSDDGITFGVTNSLVLFVQNLPETVRKPLIGRTVTLAATVSTGQVLSLSVVVPEFGSELDPPKPSTPDGLMMDIYTHSTTRTLDIRILSGSVLAPVTIQHIALYEGEYTDETLPEYQPKGYGAELVACQTQLQRFRTEAERKTYCEDFRPTMRTTPNGMVSKFEQEIDGVTYYFAAAEL